MFRLPCRIYPLTASDANMYTWDFRSIDNWRSQWCFVDGSSVALRINDLILKGVFFLGIKDATGEFAPYGTGFVGFWKHGDVLFTYLITATHVLDNMRRTGRPFVCRLNNTTDGADLGLIDIDNWQTSLSHPGCDVAVTTLAVSVKTFDVAAMILNSQDVLTDEYIQQNNVGCGDEVFTAGLLVNHFGSSKNLPIIRIGNIAAMPEEPVDLGEKWGQQEVYLIESRSIGGLSGSPVFLHTPPYRIINGSINSMRDHNTEYLLGVNIGLFETNAHSDSISVETVEKREAFLESISAGIAVVIPIRRVIEIIEHNPVLIKQREKAMNERQKTTGFVPTSSKENVRNGENAVSVSLPATDANPTHREDFMVLLGAAARTPPQDD